MTDLVEFIRARLDEQEKPLREVVRQLDAHAASDDNVVGIDGGWTLWGSFGRAVDAAFQPRQMLRDIDAKRHIMDAHPIVEVGRYGQSFAGPKPKPFGCETCHDDDGVTVGAGYCDTWKALGSVWPTHPDYRQEWAP